MGADGVENLTTDDTDGTDWESGDRDIGTSGKQNPTADCADGRGLIFIPRKIKTSPLMTQMAQIGNRVIGTSGHREIGKAKPYRGLRGWTRIDLHSTKDQNLITDDTDGTDTTRLRKMK
jgi:hypothetical protein